MKDHPEIKWSEVARQAMWAYASKLEMLDEVMKKSKLTEKDALEVGRRVSVSLASRYGKRAGRSPD
jgi:hypothetical protein